MPVDQAIGAELGIRVQPIEIIDNKKGAHEKISERIDIQTFRKILELPDQPPQRAEDKAEIETQILKTLRDIVDSTDETSSKPEKQMGLYLDKAFTRKDKYFQNLTETNPQLLKNYAKFFAEALKGESIEYYASDFSNFFNNLRKLEKSGYLSKILQILDEGWEIDASDYDLLIEDQFSSAGVKRFLKRVNIITDLRDTPDGQYVSAMTEFITHKDQKMEMGEFDDIYAFTNLYKKFISKISNMDSNNRIINYVDCERARKSYNYYFASADLQKNPYLRNFGEFSRDYYGSDKDSYLHAIELALIKKDGQMDESVFNQLLNIREIPVSLIHKLTNISDSQRKCLDFLQGPYSRTLQVFVPSEVYNQSDRYFPDGRIGYALVDLLIKTHGNGISNDFFSLIDRNSINRFPKRFRARWRAISNSSLRLKNFLISNYSELDTLLPHGKVTNEILKRAYDSDKRAFSGLLDMDLSNLDLNDVARWTLVFNNENTDLVETLEDPEKKEKVALFGKIPQVNNFFHTFPSISPEIANYALSVDDPLSLDKSEIFGEFASMACAKIEDREELLKALKTCSEQAGVGLDKIISDNLEILFTHNLEFWKKYGPNIKFEIPQATVLLDKAKSDKDFFDMLTNVFRANEYNLVFLTQVLKSTKTKAIPRSDIEALLTAAKEAGGLAQLMKNRRLVKKLVLNTSPAVGKYFAQNILKWDTQSDSEDHVRSRSANPDSKPRSRDKRREEKTHFEKEVSLLDISETDQEKIKAVHKALVNLMFNAALPTDSDFNNEILLELFSNYSPPKEDELDFSAAKFRIYNERLNTSREIPDFQNLWRKKVIDYFETTLVSKLSKREDKEINVEITLENILEDSLSVYKEGFQIYGNVSNEITQTLEEMNTYLEGPMKIRGIWFSGRDGIPLYLALKAAHFGEELGTRDGYAEIVTSQIEGDPRRQDALIKLALGEEGITGISSKERDKYLKKGIDIYLGQQARFYDLVKIAHISRILFDNAKTKEDRDDIKEYLESIGVTAKMLAVDTGYSGSVITNALGVLEARYDNPPIALISSNNPSHIPQIITSDPRDRADKIESLPKKRERTLAIVNRKPISFPSNPDIQLLNWVADHAIIRHFAPRENLKHTSENYRKIIAKEIDHKLASQIPNLTQENREKYLTEIFALYEKSRYYVAPVFVAFADHLLAQQSQQNEGKGKIIFAARDGLGAYNAAVDLLKKFPERYNKVSADQLAYAYLTRKVIDYSTSDLLTKYLEQLGIASGEVTIADIGMYGTMLYDLTQKLPHLNFRTTEYLVSRTQRANGFIDNGRDRQLNIFKKISGNSAIHFLEDTFSGTIQSPSRLIEVDGIIQPDTFDEGYEGIVALKREYALKAIGDYISSMSDPNNIDVEAAKKLLNDFLENEENYKSIMVPHENHS